jgi:hypothetical protein
MKVTTIVPALAVTIATLGITPATQAVGPGGWDHLGTQVLSGNPASALNGDVLAMDTSLPGQLVAAGKFTNAGGVPGANRIASWNGSAWSAVGAPSTFNGDIRDLAVAGGKIYAGGVFTDGAGSGPDFLAVYDGASWAPFCSGGLGGAVNALEVVGGTLYVGGAFQDGGSLPSADYLLGCNLATGASSSTVSSDPNSLNGVVYALTSDNAGNLYAGGGFFDVEGNTASDKVAMFNGTSWTNLGTGGGPGGGAVDDFVRSLANDGTTLYIGADSDNIAGIAQADHVAAWNGSSWHAVGANSAGTDGYLPAVVAVDALFTSGSHVYATGNWLNVGGDPTADYLADFDGAAWHPVGSNGAGDGALTAKGESFAVFGGLLHVGGNFTKAGGDSLAQFLARYTGVLPQPSNTFSLAKGKVNKANGTAKLPVTVPGPGVLTLQGKGVKSQRVPAAGLRLSRPVPGAGTVTLKVKAKGSSLKKLKALGRLKVKVTITFTPTGGTPASATRKVKLVLRPA